MSNNTVKMQAGASFPIIEVQHLNGESVTLGKPTEGTDWQMIVVYRGKHCPLCTKYLHELEKYKERLHANNVDLISVSADSKEQLLEHNEHLSVSFPVYYGLTETHMRTLGLYISIPRSAKETDHHFAEPAVIVVNAEGKVHVIDISNNPFVRPELEALVSGLEWIRNPENNYPIRGTAEY